jgi:hypothetical protein
LLTVCVCVCVCVFVFVFVCVCACVFVCVFVFVLCLQLWHLTQGLVLCSVCGENVVSHCIAACGHLVCKECDNLANDVSAS